MNMKKNRSGIVIFAVAFVVATAGIAFAHGGYGGGYGGYMMGPGMMGGYGGYGGYGMGPGMMGQGYGGYGMGPGMMGQGYGGYGMGPGMMGYGYGGGYRMGPGYGPYGNGGNNWGNLSPEQANKYQASQEQFYNATSDLRHKIYDEQFALNNELNSQNPDQTKALKLQNEISKLRGELDQKIVQHQIELRKILPDGNRQ